MPENDIKPDLAPAYGNLTVKRITDHEGEGLIIEWVNPGYKRTTIDCEGAESEMYRFVKTKYPDLSKATGNSFSVASNESGLLLQIGEINGEPVKLREKDN